MFGTLTFSVYHSLLIYSSSFLILILRCCFHLPISLAVCLSSLLTSDPFFLLIPHSYVWNASSSRNLEIMSPDDWSLLKLLSSWPCQTGVSLCLTLSVSVIFFFARTTCSQTFIKPSFVLFFLSVSPPSLSYISLASIPFFACELKAVTPYRRGFFCGDASITYPYVDREAIPDSLLIAGGIAITGIAVRQP